MNLCWIFVLVCPLLYSADSDEEALFLRRIAEFWEEGEYQIAKNQIEEFIAEYPENPYSDALCAALGDLFLREKNFSNALNYYSRIQSPEFYRRVFLNRMQCLYEMQWYATLADECEAFLENGSDLHATYFLAVALYHQCLNAAKDSEQLLKLAERAKPSFEILSQSEFFNEIAQSYAHLCCILKDFSKASEIYLNLVKNDPDNQEEMLFQMALIQSEYDKALAIQTFDQIASLNQKKAKEAVYNRMILAFDLGHYEELLQEPLVDKIPPDRIGIARLFLGRSWFNLKKYEQAVNELKGSIREAPTSETLRAALLSLLEASYQCNDLNALDQAVAKLAAEYPKDPELPKAYFSRAQILKKNENLTGAKEQLEQILAQFPEFSQKAQVIFELAHLDYKEKNWASCHKKSSLFLTQFPEHDLSPFAWRYWISSSAEIAAENSELREQFILDLEAFLKLPLANSEREEWAILLAKSYYEHRKYEKAIACLQNLTQPNASLLLSLCYRDRDGDSKRFCEMAEKALSNGANLIDPRQIHTCLFNAYLELSQSEKAADHLYAAFQTKAEIETENLFWLAETYLNRLQEEETNFALANRTALVLDQIKNAEFMEPSGDLCKTALHDHEWIVCKLAKVYSILGRIEDGIALLQALPSPGPEAQLFLAESYAKKGLKDEAIQLFDAIISTSATRTPISASASLQAVRLKLAGKTLDLAKIASRLKDLIVQKNLEGEPIYLEAGLDYVDLQSKANLAKKITLLQKMKFDFERRDDILSKDYHEARAKLPRKDRLYQGYMQLIDAEICAAQGKLNTQNQKEWNEKSKTLLQQIINEQSATALLERARILLTNIDEPQAKT